jgi:trimethylamine--corrinoid protein Co-methyltransferase
MKEWEIKIAREQRRQLMRVNYHQNVTPFYRVLSEGQIEEIESSCLEILERVGIKVDNEEARQLLRREGVHPDGNGIVKIPSRLVRKALQAAPMRIVLAGRDGRRDLVLENNRIYFGTGSDCPFFTDPYTGERRTTVFEDVHNAAKATDALEHIDFFMSLGLVSDVPQMTYDRHQFLAMTLGTSKPLVITSVDG